MSLFADYAKERLGADTIELQDGFISFQFIGKQCFLRDIYVKPEIRKGTLGSLLVESMTQRAREAGCTHITAEIHPSAENATEALHAALHIGMKLHSTSPDAVGLIKEIT